MRLNDKYKLGTDEFNVILYEKKLWKKEKLRKKKMRTLK